MIHLPVPRRNPLRALSTRISAAAVLLIFTMTVVYLDHDGYRDVDGDGLNLLDCAYYSAVSLSTTGYGDITPVSERARLVNVLLLTPARVLFLIILVGTTLELLTEQYRRQSRLNRWRRTMKDHIIICGFGTKGRSAVGALREDGVDARRILVVEEDPAAIRQATAEGLAVVEGSATRSAVLTEAHVAAAKAVIIATNSDEASVLISLTVRQLTAGRVRIIAAVREAENAPLLKQSGAHHVIVSSATAGRLLGLSTSAPPLLDVVDDLLTAGQGMALALRAARREEVNQSPRKIDDVVIALVRRGKVISLAQPEGCLVESGDMVVYIRDDRPVPATTPTLRG